MVKTPQITVVIPTRDRSEQLTRTLDELQLQSSILGDALEVVVVDDGSRVPVRAELRRFLNLGPRGDWLRCIRQPPSGPAAARNLGIAAARAPVVLFIGDDILPLPGFLQAHLRAHTETYLDENVAVLGLADLAPDLAQTPFVRWWKIWNFRYGSLLSGERDPDPSFFYTNNLSLKREFLLEHGLFDEDFEYPAYEDAELGFRLARNGLRLVFVPGAEAHHMHPMSLESACRRMVTRGRAYDLFVAKTGVRGISKLWLWLGSGPWMRPSLVRYLYPLARWGQTRVRLRLVYILVLMYHFQIGRGRVPMLGGPERSVV